jgi:hypothetical protein
LSRGNFRPKGIQKKFGGKWFLNPGLDGRSYIYGFTTDARMTKEQTKESLSGRFRINWLWYGYDYSTLKKSRRGKASNHDFQGRNNTDPV